MAEPTACPKCQGTMEMGFIVDYTHGGQVVSSWTEGEPERYSFFGKKLASLTKIKNKRMIETTTYRCTACGYLESYARR